MNITGNRTWRYGSALVLTIAAFLLRQALVSLFGSELSPWITSYPVVMCVALLAGLGPGIFATVTAALLVDYFILQPVGYLSIANPSNWLNLIVFSGMGLFMSAVAERCRRARDRLEEQIEKRTKDLQNASAYNRGLIESSLDPLVTIGHDGRITDVNLATEKVTGVPREGLIGRDFSGFFTDPERAAAGYEQVFREGSVRDYELEIKNADGHLTPVRYNATVYRDKKGDVAGVFATARDITARKRAEEALRDSEELLRITMENLLDPIFITDDEGRFTFICSNVYLILGYTVDEVRAMGSISAILGEGLFTLEELESRGEIRNIDCVISNRDGNRNDYLVSAKRVSIKGGTILYICRDVTERKRTENELIIAHKQLERLLSFNEALLSAIPTPVFYKDRDGRYLGCNRAFYELMGVTSEELEGKTVFELWPGEYAQEYHRKDLELMVNPAVRQIYEFKVRDKNGVVRPVIYTKDVFYNEDGQTAGIVGAFLDISERKQAEEELRNLNEELEQRVSERTHELEETQGALMNIVEDLNEKTAELEEANMKLKELDRLKSMFIASMSHELRTPLNSIIGFSSILHDEWLGPVSPEQKENLGIIRQSGRHLLNLINDVIDVSKIEAGKIESILEDFDLKDLILEAVNMVKKELDEKGLALHVEASLHMMHTDKRRLLQCVLNLLSNAVKYTEKGSVTVETRIVQCNESQGEGKMVEIVVTDTGIGIDKEGLKKLFQPFIRLGSPLMTIVPGTGLGLYLSRKLAVGVLKGDITVTSEFGRGSRFVIGVPSRLT